MERAAAGIESKMIAIIGLDRELLNEAVKEATGTYGRFDSAAKYIDPRKE